MEAENQQQEQEQQNQQQSQSQQFGTEQGGDYFDGDEEEVDLMDAEGDVASSDSELQVQDPSQEMNEDQLGNLSNRQEDPMQKYMDKEAEILLWIQQHPGQKWVDQDFPCSSSQFYENAANLPSWGVVFKNLEWKRPDQIIKDPKFMIVEEDKNGKNIQIDAKASLFAASWFIGALTIAGTKSQIIQKVVVEKEYFDKGFVAFQFFKNGAWNQVIVDTLLPYEKQNNMRVCAYSVCSNPQQFWIQLMEKAYVKLHKNYERICQGSILQGLIDLTGGVSEQIIIQKKQQQGLLQVQSTWTSLWGFFTQKFLLGCINTVEGKEVKNAEQGQQGILQNHYYSIIDMRDFPKDNLKLVRLRNPWGNEGVWTGAFCEEADDWQKYKAVKQEVKNVTKTKKVDGSWWMNFPDFLQQFDRVLVGKIFPQNWEAYSIQGQWSGKTNGGKCPTNILGQKTNFFETKEYKQQKQFIQIQSDDKWFNNPQYRIKVTKDTRLYISLMQQDEKITGQPYVPVSFMIAVTKSKSERIWQRPLQADIIAQVNTNGNISNQRQLTHYLTLKKHEGKQKIPKIYMIIPNIIESKQFGKKEDQTRKFFLRLLSPDALDVSELPQTLQTTVEGNWTQITAGGSRKIQVKEDGNGKKKGDIKDNPNWCKNPQYFLSLQQPTMMKIILRRGAKKVKNWKIGMTICRYQGCQQKLFEKGEKRDKNIGNLQRLLQQTSEFLQPPVLSELERKLIIQPNQNFKESIYLSEEVSALFFKWNPTEGPFIIIPSSDGQDRVFGYKLTIFSNNPVKLTRIDDTLNQVVIGRWEKDISAGGCHLNQLQKQISLRTWSLNPKYQLIFKEQNQMQQQPFKIKITLTIAEKNWKKLNPNTVNGMIGLYLLHRPEGKLTYSKQMVVNQTNFLPVKTITMEAIVGGLDSPINPNGYVIMPSTYQSKVQGSFIISVKCDRAFQLAPFK